MFDIGFWELVILFGLGLVVLGPERLPKVAMQIGNWAGQARRMARTLSAQMRAELDLEQSIGGSYSPPPASRYARPGVDELKTASGADDVPGPPAAGGGRAAAEAPESEAAADDAAAGDGSAPQRR